jgi:hypothetical protein
VSDQQGSGFVPGGGIAGYLIIRALWGLVSDSKLPAPAPAVAQRVIITPPPAVAVAIAPHAAPPVVRWTGDGELVAWRAWRLAILLHDDVDRVGPRLLSLSAACVWDGPAIRAHILPTAEAPGGIYALKTNLTEMGDWTLNEHCWVTGWVALSGRVLEHRIGYRAERAVIRELRLGVATHLAARPIEVVRNLIGMLEQRYQAPVDAGLREREIADQILASGFQPRVPELPLMILQEPWRLA